MGFKKKMLSVVASASLVASSFAGVINFNPEKAEAALQQTKKFNVTNYDEVLTLAAKEAKVQELIVVGNGKDNATKSLEKLGAKVKVNHKNYVYLAEIPTKNIMKVMDLKEVRTVGENKQVQLDIVDNPELKAKGQNELDADAVVDINQHETHGTTGVLDFHNKFKGEGTRVAIIDSGIDPGHESFTGALKNGKYGTSKIVAVQDYTIDPSMAYPIEDRYNFYLPNEAANYLAEGDVLFGASQPEGNSVTIGGVKYNTTGIDAPDDKFWADRTYFSARTDLNGDRRGNDNFGVLLAGDKVYIDTDQDRDFTDEVAFSNNEAGTFGLANFRVNNLDHEFLAEYGVNYKKVNLFTDFNGHGSHVAGITAANGPLVSNSLGAIAGEGVAPEAELVGLRVFKESGGAYTFSIQKAMVDAAVEYDADIANLSLGSSPDLNDGTGSYGELMTVLSEDTDIIFVTSAGNEGPGVDTVGSPGDVAPIISVGATINADTWAKEYGTYPYGFTVKDGKKIPNEGEGLWYFSSVGPNEAGNQKPDIVAPGSAFAAQPVQLGSYVVMQGTSMSSPYVAGAVALLKGAALKDRIPFDYEIAREALIQTARKLDGYNSVQQGGGMIDVPAAYEYLRKHMIAEVKNLDVTVYYGEKVSGGQGLKVRNEDLPETVEVLVENNTNEAKNVNVTATEDWFSPSVDSFHLAAGAHKVITVNYDASKLATGINAGTLIFDDASTPYVEARSPQTVITGVELNEDNHFRSRVTDEVQSSQTKVYTFDVQPGTKEVRFALNAISEGDDYKGRVRGIIFSPDGIEEVTTDKDAPKYSGYNGVDVLDYVYQNPKPGVWEIHVYGTHGPAEGKEVNKFQLEAITQDVVAAPGSINLGLVESGAFSVEDVTFYNYLPTKRAVKLATAGFVGPISKTINETIAVNTAYTTSFSVSNNVNTAVSLSSAAEDLDLLIHKKEDWDKYKDTTTIDQRFDLAYAISATSGSNEKVNLRLPDGEYVIEVYGFAVTGNQAFSLSYNIENAPTVGAKGEGEVKVAPQSKTLAVGQSLTTSVEITTPEVPGKYTGAVYLLDAQTNEVLQMVPITTQPSLVNEVSGATRYETGIEVSKKMYPLGGSEYVILTTGNNFPDALSAGPLASALNAPILAVGKDGKLSDEVLAEVKRLGASKVYLLGGTGVISPKVFTQLNSISINSSDVQRLETDGMPTRYGTNLAIAKVLQEEHGFDGNGVFLATGKDYADALSAASIAGYEGMPIVLTDGKTLSDEAKALLENERVYIVGGKNAVSEEVEAAVNSVALDVERLSGVNRYGTLAAILTKFGFGTDKLYVASGKNFPDALSAAPLVTANNGLLLLVEPSKLPKEVEAFLTKFAYTNNVSSVTVVGGQAAVNQSVRDALQNKIAK